MIHAMVRTLFWCVPARRPVPDVKAAEALAARKAHLAKRGFGVA
jgi:hypothetical protein